MYQVIYRFKDSHGKTRAKALVTFNDDQVVVGIEGTATELQIFAAVDGGADHVGALSITSEYLGD